MDGHKAYLDSDFNPRSREGSDKLMSVIFAPPSNFNPRSREGSDRIAQAKQYSRVGISTLASWRLNPSMHVMPISLQSTYYTDQMQLSIGVS